MGPWAYAVVSVAAVTATFLAVMAFRGVAEAVDGMSSRCGECGRSAMLPLPTGRHACWHCRHPGVHLPHLRHG